MAALLLVALGADSIGFYECSFLFLLFVFWLLSDDIHPPMRRIAQSAILAFAFTAAICGIVKFALQIPTPPGFLI